MINEKEKEVHKRVRFKGVEYWLHTSGVGSDYNLSPLDHYNEDGELLANPLIDLSYAVIQGEDIMRWGEVIGNVSELEDVV
jgi:hypothetical protein